MIMLEHTSLNIPYRTRGSYKKLHFVIPSKIHLLTETALKKNLYYILSVFLNRSSIYIRLTVKELAIVLC